MEQQRLVEKHGALLGLPGLRAQFIRLGGTGPVTEALLAGSLHFASGGAPGALLLWDRTRGAIKSAFAMNATNQRLLTVGAATSLRDLTPADRIALPAVRTSPQAVYLQMAAAQTWGAAEFARLDAQTISRAHKVHPIAAVQNEFSLLYREQADDTRKTTRDLGISFVAYAPLGRGLLTSDIADPATLSEGDTRKRQPRYSGDNLAHNRALAQKVEAIAKRKGCTPAQLALAWVLAQGSDVIPIPGTKQMKRVTENIGALNVKLSDADLAEIASAVPAGAVKGTRYPEAQMASLYI